MNDKVYIGQSIDIKRRWNKHRSTAQNPNSSSYDYPLYRAIRKYGIDNFSFEVLEECTIEELNDKEIYWIKYFDSTNENKGYNLAPGGYNSIAQALSYQEVEEIISLLQANQLSQQQIADEFDVSQRMISAINIGECWKKEDINYPIRNKTDLFLNKKNRCIICNKIISNGATYCVECYCRTKKKVERPSREILKQEIRSINFVTLGKKYGVSDNAIRKWCDNYNLPRKASDIKQVADEDWEKI